MNSNNPTNQNLATYLHALSPEQAFKLSNYLPVSLRDFWLSVDPVYQAWLVKNTRDQYEFFTMIQMEAARFGQISGNNSRMNPEWSAVVGVIESKIVTSSIAARIEGGKQS